MIGQSAMPSDEEAQAIRLIDLIIRQAIRRHASTIYIEPLQERISLRFLVDGMWQDISPPPSQLMPAIVARMKILAKLDLIGERIAQEGGFRMLMEGHQFHFGVLVTPTMFGEKVVITPVLETPPL